MIFFEVNIITYDFRFQLVWIDLWGGKPLSWRKDWSSNFASTDEVTSGRKRSSSGKEDDSDSAGRAGGMWRLCSVGILRALRLTTDLKTQRQTHQVSTLPGARFKRIKNSKHKAVNTQTLRKKEVQENLGIEENRGHGTLGRNLQLGGSKFRIRCTCFCRF